MFLCRYVIFSLQESPKFLVATGRDEDAIEALTYIARRNGKSISLTAEKLLEVGRVQTEGNRPSAWVLLKNSFAHLSLYVTHFIRYIRLSPSCIGRTFDPCFQQEEWA